MLTRIPTKYQGTTWAVATEATVARARKAAAGAKQASSSSATTVLVDAVPGAAVVGVTGFIDEKYGNLVPIGEGGLSATELSAIAMPVAAIATGSTMIAKAAAGPLHVTAYLMGRKLAIKTAE